MNGTDFRDGRNKGVAPVTARHRYHEATVR
jgi:hypothetical protein